jgi:hypothetical protein
MGILKGILGSNDEEALDGLEALDSPFSKVEAALDRAIQQRQTANASSDPKAPALQDTRSHDWPGGDRRQANGDRPDGLPDRRSGADRRSGGDRRSSLKEFGRRRPD